MNTLQSNAEFRLNRLLVPHENSELEELWTSVFCDEYKPEVEINFERIKDTFSSSAVANLCDYMLSLDSKKKNSISVLESLHSSQKKTLVDVFLHHPLEKIQEKCGLAMVFWLWYYSSPYNDKTMEMFKNFWIKSDGKDRYNLLEKARSAQNYPNRSIGLTLKQYIGTKGRGRLKKGERLEEGEYEGKLYRTTLANGKKKFLKVDAKWHKYKGIFKERIESQEGKQIASKRKIDVEPVFGNIKHNLKFTRFSLRGFEKASIERNIVCIAHNLKKLFSLSMI